MFARNTKQITGIQISWWHTTPLPVQKYWAEIYIDIWHYVLKVVFVCLQITFPRYHHYAELSDSIYSTSQVYIAECLFKIKSVCTYLLFCNTICGAVYFQIIHFSFLCLWENLYFILPSSPNRKHASLAIVYMWSHETMVCALYV